MKRFTDQNSNLMVVDGLNLGFRWKHSKSTGFAEQYLRTIQSLAASYHCAQIVVLSDYGQSKYRKALDPLYKDNRRELRENQTEEEEQEFRDFLEELQNAFELCKEDGMKVIKVLNVEADDIAAYISQHFDKSEYDHLWLISSDGDWDLLLNEYVSRFSYVTRKEYTLENWEEEHVCETPDDFVSIKAIQGDKGDNIPGVSGIGPKRASDLVSQFGSVFDLCESLPLPGKAKYIENLNSSRDRMLLNVELVDLLSYCEEAIGEENLEIIKEELGDILK